MGQDIPTHIWQLLHQAWYRAAVIDPQLSSLAIYGSEVIADFQKWVSADTYQWHIWSLLTYIDELEIWSTGSVLLNAYISLLDWVSEFQDDVFSLLWFNAPQTYIVVLQNTSESRPNGGFFWSFALLTLDAWRMSKLEIVDSYHPARENPDLQIVWPEWLLEFLPHRDIHFIWANKIWYTYHDGAHIQQLYERAYPRQPIRWVIFVSTKMITQILPDFAQAQRERQFVNAASDLIRGDEFGKKEIYINQSAEYFQSHAKELAIWLVQNLPKLISQRYINVYLDDITVSGGEQGGGLTQWLRDHQLTTRYEDDHVYVWWSNISYNKIDTWITKTTTISDAQSRVLLVSTDDQIDLGSLVGVDGNIYDELVMEIQYRLDIPQVYREYIWWLESEYNIELTDRERHILWLTPARGSRALIYLPGWYSAISVDGRAREIKMFSTPFADAVSYETDIQADGGESSVVVKIRR